MNIKGNYRWKTSLDRETGVMTIHFEQSLWEKYVSCIFYPYDNLHEILKKDEIKEVYVDKDGTTTTIWENSEEEQKAYLSEKTYRRLGIKYPVFQTHSKISKANFKDSYRWIIKMYKEVVT